MGFLRHAAVVAWKDLRVELRTREIVYTMLFLATMVVLIFSFAFIEQGQAVGDVSAGILWVAVAFAGGCIGHPPATPRFRDPGTRPGLGPTAGPQVRGRATARR